MDELKLDHELLIESTDIELVEKVGIGGFGEVWKGHWWGCGVGILVAVKKVVFQNFSKQILQDFAEEVTVMAKLRHKHIVQLLGVSIIAKNEVWLITEYAEGGSLYSLLHSEVEIAWEKRWLLAFEAAKAINYLHHRSNPIIHRDIKSSNFLISEGTIKLAGFNMSSHIRIASKAHVLPNTRLGSTRWLAPETSAQVPQWTVKSDIFSFGVSLWEIAARQIPFSDIHQVKYERERPTIPDSCPPAFAEVIHKCWAQNPNDRPSSMEVLTMIEHRLPKPPSPLPPMSHEDKEQLERTPILLPSVRQLPSHPTTKFHDVPKKNFHTKGPPIGIDLGNSFTRAAVMRNGKIELIPNSRGNTSTPSVVAFSNHREFGDIAMKKMQANPQNTVFNAKMLLRSKTSSDLVEHVPYKVSELTKDHATIQVELREQQREFTVEEILAMHLSKIKDDAEIFLRASVTQAVISAPCFYSPVQRERIRAAGTIAGFEVLRIIDDTTCALMAHDDINTISKDERHVLVIGMGSSSTSVSVITAESDVYEVKSVHGADLGGEDVTRILMDYLMEDFKRKTKKDLKGNKRALCKLWTAAEQAKRTLSISTTAHVHIDALFDGIDCSTSITREKLEELCNGLFRDFIDCIDAPLRQNGLLQHQLAGIFLFGGTSPTLQLFGWFSQYFAHKPKLLNQDQVAIGAAIQACLLTGMGFYDTLVMEVTPVFYYIEASEPNRRDPMVILVSQNQTIPCKKALSLTTTNDNQKNMAIKLYSGSNLINTEWHATIGLFNIASGPKGTAQIEVTIDIDHNFRIFFTVENKKQNNGKIRTEVIKGFSQHQLKSLGNESEVLRQIDEEESVRVATKETLENYLWAQKDKLKESDTTKRKQCDGHLQWLDDNSTTTTIELKERLQKVKTQFM